MKVTIRPKHTVTWCCERHYQESASKDAEITRLRAQLDKADAVVRAAKALEFSAYPAHGSGFVMQVIGNTNALRDALAALRERA